MPSPMSKISFRTQATYVIASRSSIEADATLEAVTICDATLSTLQRRKQVTQ